MATFQRNFIAGKMNKSVDERLVPNGQYIDAVNVRLGSSESTEIGAVENSKGNTLIAALSYEGQSLSGNAKCIGAYDDGANETIYWWVHDPTFLGNSPTGKIDLIISFNTVTNDTIYHVISVSKGGINPTETVLNLNEKYLITGIDLIDGLLFWTDNYNAPRFINTNRGYPIPSGSPRVDGNGNAALLEESFLVIKKPPRSAPTIELTSTTGGDENYLDERFISFAYRYEYQDDEYSATSQFSDAAFNTSPFNFSPESYLNEGVVNRFNTAIITYNSGGPLVTAIDLLFKDSDGTIIKVIEKIKKSDLGLADNTDYTFTFRNSKIFTILPESELLRLYDNVPLFAKSQTLMGNRLMYGNYIENYNLVDINDSPVRFEFETELISELIGLESIEDSTDNASYTFGATVNIVDGGLVIDLEDVELVAGSLISIDASFIHRDFQGNTPTETTPQINIEWSYVLPQDFNSVYDLATSLDFQEKVGVGTLKPVYDSDPLIETSCEGQSLTDIINCNIPNILDASQPTSWTKFESGISSANQPVGIVTSVGSNTIGFELIAMRRVDDVAAPTQNAYEYYGWNFAEVTYQKISDTKSLHSNRDYEIGIIYMDEYNRASTALVSPLNSEHVPCGFSDQKNSIQVTIPTQQRPPYWATKYKFAIKPSAEGYETIYTNIFFQDPSTAETYFLLEGENQRKVEVGDRYIVKLDTQGSLLRCAYATVLEKEAKESEFIQPPPTDAEGEEIIVPAGTYMKMKAQDFSVALGDNPFILPGKQSDTATNTSSNIPYLEYPFVNYQGFGEDDGTGNFINYTIPAGSRIKLDFEFVRRGPQKGDNRCERRKYRLNVALTSSQDYDDIIDWFNGDNVQAILNTGQQEVGGTGCDVDNEYINSTATSFGSVSAPWGITPSVCTNYYRWFKDPGSNEIQFIVSGTKTCGSTKKRRSTVNITFQIFRAESTIVFETFPTDAQPDVWYEGSETFDIVKEGCLFDLSVSSSETNPIAFEYTLNGFQEQVILEPGESMSNINGDCNSMATSSSTPPDDPANITILTTSVENVHLGNIQSQTLSQSAIIDTSFFNCFAFGNGVESYKIRDSLVGKPLVLGNRFTTTSAEDYRQADRFADISYSGIYNDESNVNKLNEFNLGLLNFKKLEESFGPIQKLFARSTDILTLQEDKISYVLAGKNLLSDSAVGGAITSVPEVLGTQIARLEEYGISFNPESFAVYGYDKYFSDQKRGVLLQLKGSAYSNEQLTVISEAGMRSWFRDRFIAAPNTQKLGGYDPYMDEYVFSTNDDLLPIEDPCIDCGVTKVFVYSQVSRVFCFNLGQLVGDVNIDVTVSNLSNGPFTLTSIYDGNTSLINLNTGLNTLTFDKDKILTETVELTFSGTLNADVEFIVNCPIPDTIEIIQVCVSDKVDAGQSIHNQYRWIDGVFVSPLHQEQVKLKSSNTSPLISQYSSVSGPQGAGIIPADGAIVSIISKKILPTDDFVFANPPMNFKYLRSSTLYVDTPASIQDLINASTQGVLDASGATSTYLSQFIMPSGNDFDKLYLIYDYREPVLAELCYSTLSAFDACCGCADAAKFIATQCRLDGVVNTEVIQGPYTVGQFVQLAGLPDCYFEITDSSTDEVTDTVSALTLGTDCDNFCQEYDLISTNPGTTDIDYVDCDFLNQTVSLPENTSVKICARSIDPIPANVTITLSNCECNIANLVQLERCVLDWSVLSGNTEYATNAGYTIGDLVSINTDSCVYEVVAFVSGSVTTNVTSLNPVADCSDVCNYYNVTGAGPGPQTFTYRDCGGIKDTNVVIGELETIQVCTAQAIDQSANFSIVWQSCDCPVQNHVIEDCVTGETLVGSYPTQLALNTTVNVSGVGCLWKVTGYTFATPDIIISSISGDSCDNECNFIQFENNTNVNGSVTVVNCTGTTVTQLMLPFSAYSSCIKSIVSRDPEITIYSQTCNC